MNKIFSLGLAAILTLAAIGAWAATRTTSRPATQTATVSVLDMFMGKNIRIHTIEDEI